MVELSKSIEPTTRAFLEKVNAGKGPQIYELSPEDARAVLSKLQKSHAPVPPAEVEDMDVPGGPQGKIPIRIVRKKGSSGALPVVVYFHGGGWVLGDKYTHDRLISELVNEVNTAVVFVGYTRSPEAKYPVPIEESYTVLEHIAKNGKELGLDPSRLAVAGDSVGGNMATVVSYLARQRKGPRIQYQALFYPVTDANFETESYRACGHGNWLSIEAMKWFWDQYLPDKDARKQITASPLLASPEQLKGLPPALVITAEFDVLRDEGEAYAHKLSEAGVPVTAVRYLGTIHDFMMLNPLANTPAARSATSLAAHMLKEALTKLSITA